MAMGNYRIFFYIFGVLGVLFTLLVLGAILLGYMNDANRTSLLSCLIFGLCVTLGAGVGIVKTKGKKGP